MLRAGGIPSRNVTGFLEASSTPTAAITRSGSPTRTAGSRLSFSSADGATLDPTPPSRFAVGPTDWLLRDLSALVDAARAYWMTKVVSYDVRMQLRFLR